MVNFPVLQDLFQIEISVFYKLQSFKVQILQQQAGFLFDKRTYHLNYSKETENMLHQVYLLLQKTGHKFLLFSEGRDKLTKFLIYLFKFIDATKSIYSRNQTYELEKIAHHLQKARQFMRLAKFIQQFSRIIKLIKEPTKDEYRRLVQIIIHTFFSFYWVLDNLCLLSAFNIIEAPQFQLSQTQMTIKVIALTIAAILNLRNWIKLHHQEIKARKMLKVLKGEQNLKKNVELLQLIKQQWKMFLLCVKIYGDILPSFAKSTFAKKTLKVQIPRLIQALGGLTNAIVSCFLTSM